MELILGGEGVFESTLEKIHDGGAIILARELKLLHGENEVAQTTCAVNLALEFHLHLLLTLRQREVHDVPLVIIELRFVQHVIHRLVGCAIKANADELRLTNLAWFWQGVGEEQGSILQREAVQLDLIPEDPWLLIDVVRLWEYLFPEVGVNESMEG